MSRIDDDIDRALDLLEAESIARRADVLLIAAAPELLESAEAVVATAWGETYGLSEAEQLEALRLACKALRDATDKATITNQPKGDDDESED